MDLDESGISGVDIHLIRMIIPGSEVLVNITSTDINAIIFTGISFGKL